MITITNMEMFKLAQNAVSKDETRLYLTGINIKPCGTVQASDGHMATVGLAVEGDIPEGGIVIKTKPIPAPQIEGEIDLENLLIRTKNRKGEESLQPLTIMDVRFPILDDIIPSEDREANISSIGLNPHLLAQLAKRTYKFTTMRLSFGSHEADPILIKYSDMPEATSVLMPVRI